MKTQQIIKRDFLGEKIRQNHKTKMFSVTDISKLESGKFVADWKKTDITKNFIAEICKQESLHEKDVIISLRGKGEYSGTWAHPLLAVDFAMWINPEFKYHALKWVYDNVCDYRDKAGDYYNEMKQTIKDVIEPGPKDFMVYVNEARMLNKICGIKDNSRNNLTEEKLKKLNFVQQLNIKLLRKGIKSRLERESKIKYHLDIISGTIIDIA